MPFPTAEGPATPAAVKLQLGITDGVDDALIQDVVDAVNQVVTGFRIAQQANLDIAADDWSAWPRIERGAAMLAARIFRRKDTPDGVAAFADQAAIYVQRNDPDVAQLLQLGAHAKPAVG